jgi:hypothetical protein
MSSEDFNGPSGSDFMASGADHWHSAKAQVGKTL